MTGTPKSSLPWQYFPPREIADRQSTLPTVVGVSYWQGAVPADHPAIAATHPLAPVRRPRAGGRIRNHPRCTTGIRSRAALMPTFCPNRHPEGQGTRPWPQRRPHGRRQADSRRSAVPLIARPMATRQPLRCRGRRPGRSLRRKMGQSSHAHLRGRLKTPQAQVCGQPQPRAQMMLRVGVELIAHRRPGKIQSTPTACWQPGRRRGLPGAGSPAGRRPHSLPLTSSIVQSRQRMRQTL